MPRERKQYTPEEKAQKQREYCAKYRATHKEQIKEYRESHKDRFKQYKATWRARHRKAEADGKKIPVEKLLEQNARDVEAAVWELAPAEDACEDCSFLLETEAGFFCNGKDSAMYGRRLRVAGVKVTCEFWEG